MDESQVEGRVPPHDLDCEAAVLSAVIVDEDAYPRVGDFLLPEHFYSESHRRVFEACAALASDNKPIDKVTVATWLRDHDRLAQVGGMAYLTEILNSAPVAGNARPYGERVHVLWRLRQTLISTQRVAAQIYGGVAEPQEFLEATAETFHEFAFTPGVGSGLEAIGPILNATVARVEAAERSGQSMLGMATGITRYDRVTGGLHDGDQTIVAARPGKGKSSLALQWAVQVAAHDGPVAFFSLEMPKDQLALRAACAEGRVDVQRARIGKLSAGDWSKLTPAQAFINRLPLFIDDTPAITVAGIRAKLRRLQIDLERGRIKLPSGMERRIRLVVVDYLQLMHASARAARHGREREVAECSADLKSTAKQFRIPFVTLSQMNRAIEDAKRRPLMRDLRESGAIEQDADNIVFIHEHSSEPHVSELIIEKQRNGPKAIVCVRFDAQYTRFDNLAEGEFEDYDGEPEPDNGPLPDPSRARRAHSNGHDDARFPDP